MDLTGQAGEQRSNRRVFASGFGDQVQRPVIGQECFDVQGLAGRGEDGGGEGGVGEEREASAHGHPDGGDGFVGFAAHFGELAGEVAGRAGGGGEDVLGFVEGVAGDPAGDVGEVQAGEGCGVEVAAEVVRGFGGPEAGVFDAFLGNGAGERVGAADRDGGFLAAGQGVPAEGGGDAADVLGVEHVHGSLAGAGGGGELVDVVFGGGGQDRAGVAQDDPGEPSGFSASGRAEDDGVLVQRQPQGVAVVAASGQDRIVRCEGEEALGVG